jgi:hypothetical protein
MKTTVIAAVAIMAALACSYGSATAAELEMGKQSAEVIATAKKSVTDHLEILKGNAAVVSHIQDEALERILPDRLCFAVLFRQHPAPRIPPDGLKVSNVFIVLRGEKLAAPVEQYDAQVSAPAPPRPKVVVLTGTQDLQEFYKTTVFAKEESEIKDAARAWLRLSQEFAQDGFYGFSLMDDSIKVTEDHGAKVVRGKVVVMKGGNGEINATLTFDERGQLAKAEEDVKLKPGPRPIRQATKMHDADPIVRRIAEQDLLIMGRAAKPYLDEQRAKASPELQKAIDRMWERIEKEDR